MKILIVEDEPIVALDLRMMVEDMGHEVFGCCGSVRSGLRLVDGDRPDLAILDVRLEDGDVFPLADELQQKDVLMVFHSGHAELDAIHRRYHTASFCPKPTTTRELQDTIAAMAGDRVKQAG